MSCSKKWLRELEKDYETMTWLRCVVEDARTLHSKLCCTTVCQKYEGRICGMKHYLCIWITGSGNQKLAMSWIMPCLALLLHIVLSCMIRFNMYLEIPVTGQCQNNIYLARHFVRHSKKL